jgi:ribosomal protein S6--L-glutamate ligase
MKICIMLGYARDKGDVPVLAELIENLRAEAFDVVAEPPELVAVNANELLVDADLFILKSKSDLWLNVAAELDAKGARILNTYPASVDTLNKIRSTPRLFAAGIPIPRSWVTDDSSLFSEIPDGIPLLIKPNIGHGGAGIRTFRDRAELAATPIGNRMLVQEMLTPVEDELKLYVIGDRVFAIRKHSETGERENITVEPMLGDIALKCGRALGLDIHGVDVLLTSDGPFVVDVNYFPSFRAVPNAARTLADHISAYARQ